MIEHMAMVFAADGLKHNEKVLLLAYAYHADAHGYCWPGIRRLAHETGMAERTVARTNTLLRQRGLIKAVQRVNPRTGQQISNLTRINVELLRSMRRPDTNYDDNLIDQITFDAPANAEVAGESDEPDPELQKLRAGQGGRQSDTPTGATPTQGGCQSDTPGASICHPGGVNLTPKTPIEPPEKESPPPPRDTSSTPAMTPTEEEEGKPSEENDSRDAEVLRIIDEAVSTWRGYRRPNLTERRKLAQRISRELAAGATPEAVRHALTRDLEPGQARSAVAVVMARTAQPGWAELPTLTQSDKPNEKPMPACSTCRANEGDGPGVRTVQRPDGRVGPCPDCRPALNADVA